MACCAVIPSFCGGRGEQRSGLSVGAPSASIHRSLPALPLWYQSVVRSPTWCTPNGFSWRQAQQFSMQWATFRTSQRAASSIAGRRIFYRSARHLVLCFSPHPYTSSSSCFEDCRDTISRHPVLLDSAGERPHWSRKPLRTPAALRRRLCPPPCAQA
jgi:hypothetical protein